MIARFEATGDMLYIVGGMANRDCKNLYCKTIRVLESLDGIDLLTEKG
jgi:hypothetical protein